MVCVRILFLLLVLLNLPACSFRSASRPDSLTVFAAASLTAPFEAITQVFKQAHPGLEVSLVLAGSQQLATQLREGAHADVFASANQSYLDAIVDAGLANAADVAAFATSSLVVVVPAENPGHINSLLDLAHPGHRLVLAAAEVPVGQYSLEFMIKASQDAGLGADYQERVLSNVVSYENNVKTVLAKVVLGEADAGIVYSSDVSPDLLDQVSRIEIPDHLNVSAVYPITLLKESLQPELAKSFITFVLSPQGQALLAEHGFRPVAP
jgi:molybdate transport system substrate-binding protein